MYDRTRFPFSAYLLSYLWLNLVSDVSEPLEPLGLKGSQDWARIYSIFYDPMYVFLLINLILEKRVSDFTASRSVSPLGREQNLL